MPQVLSMTKSSLNFSPAWRLEMRCSDRVVASFSDNQYSRRLTTSEESADTVLGPFSTRRSSIVGRFTSTWCLSTIHNNVAERIAALFQACVTLSVQLEEQVAAGLRKLRTFMKALSYRKFSCYLFHTWEFIVRIYSLKSKTKNAFDRLGLSISLDKQMSSFSQNSP